MSEKKQRATYSAMSAAFSPPATPTDLATITGSATKTVFVTGVKLSAVQGTAGINAFHLVKRSAANTVGTSAALTAVPHDSASAAATATPLSYTANPTTGAAVGTIHSAHILCPKVDSIAPDTGRKFDFGGDGINAFKQPIVLRGIAEVLAINFAGVALPSGLSVIAGFEWYEE